MYEDGNSFKLPTLDERELKPKRAKKEHTMRGCLTTGILVGLFGLGSCAALADVASNNYFDYKQGSIEIMHKQESGGYAGAPTYDLMYFGSSCFFDKYWENGHVIHSPSILTANLGDKSIIIDPNLFGCP